MTPAILVFLGIIALCSLVQAVFFAGLAFASWKAAARVDDLADRAQTDLTRIADKVEGLTARLETLSRQARETLERTEPIVTKGADPDRLRARSRPVTRGRDLSRRAPARHASLSGAGWLDLCYL
jgi:hypothetical protein